jgi:ABC-type phosphate transport system permease subunit
MMVIVVEGRKRHPQQSVYVKNLSNSNTLASAIANSFSRYSKHLQFVFAAALVSVKSSLNWQNNSH